MGKTFLCSLDLRKKYGNFANECHNNNNQQRKFDNEAHLAQDNDSSSDPIVFMVTPNFDLGNFETWYLDSGCSNYMTIHREWLIDFDGTKKSKVRFADNITMPVEGMGNVIIKRKNGKFAMISGVLYVPNMKNNLLNVTTWAMTRRRNKNT